MLTVLLALLAGAFGLIAYREYAKGNGWSALFALFVSFFSLHLSGLPYLMMGT